MVSISPEETQHLQVVIPNLHWRYSGVTATNRMVAPKLAGLFRAAWLGPDAPDGIARMDNPQLRVLRWPHWVALGALFVAGLTVGDEDQGSWLLMNTAFPFIQLRFQPGVQAAFRLGGGPGQAPAVPAPDHHGARANHQQQEPSGLVKCRTDGKAPDRGCVTPCAIRCGRPHPKFISLRPQSGIDDTPGIPGLPPLFFVTGQLAFELQLFRRVKTGGGEIYLEIPGAGWQLQVGGGSDFFARHHGLNQMHGRAIRAARQPGGVYHGQPGGGGKPKPAIRRFGRHGQRPALPGQTA